MAACSLLDLSVSTRATGSGAGEAGTLTDSASAAERDSPAGSSAGQSIEEVATRVDLSDEAVHWDLGSALSYDQYLRLDRVLSAQEPLSTQHDEMLFIIVHQVSELWM